MNAPFLPPTQGGVPPRSSWPPHLHRRAGSRKFYARVRVPPSLKRLLGTHLERSLRTDRYPEALRRLPIVVAELRKRIEQARRDPETGALLCGGPQTPDQRAEWWVTHLQKEGHQPDPAKLPEDIYDQIIETAEEIAGDVAGVEVGPDGELEVLYDHDHEARRFLDLVFRKVLPVEQELDRFLTERAYPQRTADKHRLAVRRLKDYLKATLGSDDARQVTREVAGRFVDHLLGTGMVTETANSHVSKLNVYWAWLVDRLGLKANPWRNQQRRKRKGELTAAKRPFTDDEVRKLLTGETYRTLHDMMRIAALSGMRIDEIARQRVGDVLEGVFRVHEGKTSASLREVPVHSGLTAIIARRSAGKQPHDRLFHELRPSPSRKKELSAKASERFTAYRRSVGVDERAEGQRQSNVDFHSWRRWAATQAEQAGNPPHIVSAVLGHEEGRKGMTLGRYSAGPSLDQKRAVIESIKLPDGVPWDSPDGPLLGERGTRRGR